MTQDEIIEMAKQACDVLTDNRGRMTFCFDEYGLEAFAKLVAAKERENWSEVKEYLIAARDGSMSRNNSQALASELLDAIQARGEA